MSKCQGEDDLVRLHAGEMSSNERALVDEHLRDCCACSQRDTDLVAEHERLVEQVRAIARASDDGLARTKESEPSVPELPGYGVLNELHRGGQGIVYEALQETTKRRVAIKLLLSGRYASRSAQKRFEREIELVAQLKHPHIISIFHSGVLSDGTQFYVMDYVRGLRLDQYVRENDLVLEETLRLFYKVCNGIQYAHQRGVIHRDLKPSNIMVDADGDPRILDFGLAKLLAGPVDTIISVSQSIMGTLPYMSPEQARGNPDQLDTRTDVYSLGVILYELLTGHYPYPVTGEMASVLRHIAETAPTPPSSKWTIDSGVRRRSRQRERPGKCPIDEDVQTVILKALSKERGRRYQSAGELARDISHYLANEPIEARRESSWYVLRKLLARQRARLTMAAAVVFVLASAVALAWTQRRLVEGQQREIRRLNSEGADLTDAGRWDEAEQRLRRALELDPDSADTHATLARMRVKEHRARNDPQFDDLLRQAERECLQAIEIQPTNDLAWNTLGVARKRLGEYEEAVRAYDDILLRNPDSYFALTNKGTLLALLGHLDDALDHLERATYAANVEQGCPYSVDAWRNLGSLQLYLGDRMGGLAALHTAIECDPNDAGNKLLEARYLIGDDNTKAEAALAVADHLRGQRIDPRLYRLRARLSLNRGAFEAAVDWAQEAIDAGGRPALNHLVIAIAQAKSQGIEDARHALSLAEDEWPIELRQVDGFLATADDGVLWFETAEELDRLRAEAEDNIDAQSR